MATRRAEADAEANMLLLVLCCSALVVVGSVDSGRERMRDRKVSRCELKLRWRRNLYKA